MSSSVLRLATATAAAHQLDSPEFAALLDQLTLEFAAGAAQHDRDASFPHQNFERLHQLGLLGLTVPRAQGGLGASLAQTARVIAAVARGEPSTALVLTMQYLHHASARHAARWPRHLRELVVQETLRDGALINALRVEPDLGTPARGGLPATTAHRTPDGWRISGRKVYSTGIPRLTWLAVWARSDDAEPLVGSWLVRRDTPGISVVESWDHLGMRATGSHDVIFDEVLVPLEHAVEVAPAGATQELDAELLCWMSVLLASIYDAVARAGRDWLANWLQERVPANLGAPLASLPRFQEALGLIDTWLFSNRTLIDAAAAGRIAAADSFRIKYLVTSQAIQVVEKAIELSGNPGLSNANPLQRHYRDVLCSRIHTPQNDTILINSGRAAFAALAAQKTAASSRAGATGPLSASTSTTTDKEAS
ncbi:acyl-CoA dehydrogenase family protein [Janthinobacterium agaricidamnosum]|uniref:Acyl-CoA dehydrogenase, middle domain protein n=1 Tax=Janthinobacterium agaricidamnosum NBRC 102515 = DSM 9628 TaxID=1349767 RepID=W0V501_9BURK|nr:acyl-CoA dehydrogenase family protein [Janthinobacterium agaricidamnosum]CDG82352.1 acyl-CoA dehydrogenase, middle domain protein [Janthinobacterium agaricidamnosum NBRC 102515 = DSM 9628]